MNARLQARVLKPRVRPTLRDRLARADFEYVLIGCALIVMGALSQINDALGLLP